VHVQHVQVLGVLAQVQVLGLLAQNGLLLYQ